MIPTLQQWLIDWVYRGLADEPWHTQGWLAQKAGLSEKHVSQLLTGRACGSLDVWDRLLDVVGVRDEALGG